MKLGRSFFSLYFLIIACFGVLSYALDEIWSKNVEQDIESYTGYKTLLIAIHDRLQAVEQQQWNDIIEVANERYKLPILMVTEEEVEALIPNLKFVKSDDVTVYYDADFVTLFLPFADNQRILVLGPVPSPTRPKTEALVRVIILVVLAVVVFFWIWPVSRDLDRLAKAVQAFGDGQFSAKVDRADSSLVRPMVATFNMMATRINHLIEAHKELTTAVSHELRTPLARSKFALQVLRNASDEPMRKKYTDSIDRDICELENLVNELLVYASFENEQPDITIEQTDMKSLLHMQVQHYDDDKVHIGLSLPEENVVVTCDPYFINRALSNLISNAIKYGKGEILLTLSLQHSHCRIDVEDNGDGVDDDFKAIIFDAFSRYDQSRGKDTGGFGLGLAIVNKIMQWHRGRAEVSDSALGGAKFSLLLPIESSKH